MSCSPPLYLSSFQARSMACPSAPRQCVAEECAAWVRAPDGWPRGAGRCAWHVRGDLLSRIGMLVAIAQRLTDLPGPMPRSLPLWLALDFAEQQIERCAGVLSAELAKGSAKAVEELTAEIAARGVALGAAGAAWGAGRSPAGAVGNTPPAKCSACAKGLKSKDPDRRSALCADGWIRAMGSRLGPRPVSEGRVLRRQDEQVGVGDQVVDRRGGRGVVVHVGDFDDVNHDRPATIRLADGTKVETWLRRLVPHRRRPRGPSGPTAPPVGSPRKAASVVYVPGDLVEVRRVRGIEKGVVRAEMAPGADGQVQYLVHFDVRGSTEPIAADCMRLATAQADGGSTLAWARERLIATIRCGHTAQTTGA